MDHLDEHGELCESGKLADIVAISSEHLCDTCIGILLARGDLDIARWLISLGKPLGRNVVCTALNLCKLVFHSGLDDHNLIGIAAIRSGSTEMMDYLHSQGTTWNYFSICEVLAQDDPCALAKLHEFGVDLEDCVLDVGGRLDCVRCAAWLYEHSLFNRCFDEGFGCLSINMLIFCVDHDIPINSTWKNNPCWDHIKMLRLFPIDMCAWCSKTKKKECSETLHHSRLEWKTWLSTHVTALPKDICGVIADIMT